MKKILLFIACAVLLGFAGIAKADCIFDYYSLTCYLNGYNYYIYDSVACGKVKTEARAHYSCEGLYDSYVPDAGVMYKGEHANKVALITRATFLNVPEITDVSQMHVTSTPRTPDRSHESYSSTTIAPLPAGETLAPTVTVKPGESILISNHVYIDNSTTSTTSPSVATSSIPVQASLSSTTQSLLKQIDILKQMIQLLTAKLVAMRAGR